jgi:hypothetical protein
MLVGLAIGSLEAFARGVSLFTTLMIDAVVVLGFVLMVVVVSAIKKDPPPVGSDPPRVLPFDVRPIWALLVVMIAFGGALIGIATWSGDESLLWASSMLIVLTVLGLGIVLVLRGQHRATRSHR